MRRKKLYPAYLDLEAKLEQEVRRFELGGEDVRSGLPRMNQLYSILNEIAQRHKLLVAGIEPMYQTVDNEEGSIDVTVNVDGSTVNFSRFLTEIIKNPWFVEMKSIRVQSMLDSRKFRILFLLSFDITDLSRQ